MRSIRERLVLSLLLSSSIAHACVEPGTCIPPAAQFSRVIPGPKPGQQWNINGGFCGSWSIQQTAKAFGAWISQDVVRKANRDQPIQHYMHGDEELGYEVVPSNQAYTAQMLKLKFDEFDYTQPSPQSIAWKTWVKSHLVRGEPVVMMPMCKGDPHRCYPFSCPGGGHIDHVEPIWAIFSNYSLDDTTVYDDDVILHASDQDLEPYYRKMVTLEDTTAMDSNCAGAQAGFGKNEMYPCVDQDVTYGLAIMGLNVSGATLLPVSLDVLGLEGEYEPDVRNGESASALTANVTVGPEGLVDGGVYTLYRFDSTDSLPSDVSDFEASATSATSFTYAESTGPTWSYLDPETFPSDSAVYYAAIQKSE
jgi:hypothetical protein